MLGVSFGQTIVRVDIDTRKIPTITPSPAHGVNPDPVPWFRENPQPVPWPPAQGGVVPFSLATAQQAPPALSRHCNCTPLLFGLALSILLVQALSILGLALPILGSGLALKIPPGAILRLVFSILDRFCRSPQHERTD